MTKAKDKAHPQLSYDALLIHGLMLVFAAGTVTVAGFVTPESRDLVAAQGVGLTATLVLGLWSLVLGVRAMLKQETSRWPVVVMGLLILETLALGIAFLAIRYSRYTVYDWVMILGLPVFIPVFFLASLIAAPIAWWRTRRAEKKETANGGVPWTTRRRWKRWLCWYFTVASLVSIIVLPMPLFVFCALVYHRGGWPVDSRWHDWVVTYTPTCVVESTAEILKSSGQPTFVELYKEVLHTPHTTEDRLISELNAEDNGVAETAWRGLSFYHVSKAIEVAKMVGENRLALRHRSLAADMCELLATRLPEEELERYVDPNQEPWPPLEFLDVLTGRFRNITKGHITKMVRMRARLNRNLEHYCDSKPPNREAALKRLARFAKSKDIERLWANYLSDKDPERRKQAITSIAFIENPNTALSVLAAGLESQDETLRGELARNIQDILIMGHERTEPKVLARLVKALLPFLDGQGVAQSSGLRGDPAGRLTATQDAAWVLTTLIKAPQLEDRVRDIANWTAPGQSSLNPEARKLIEDVRAAAGKWLEGK